MTQLIIDGVAARQREPWRMRAWRWSSFAVLYLVLVAVFRATVADINYVPSGSMAPTLSTGDFIFVNVLAYGFKLPFTQQPLWEWSAPERGDVVVFYAPGREKRFVKRVVGLPGDSIEMRQGQLFVNGKPTSEASIVRGEAGSFGPQTVPPGRFFVMGDNRGGSIDSRSFGGIERWRIIGRATAVIFALDRDACSLPRWDRCFRLLP